MPKSPLALADDISLEIVLQYEDQAAEHYGTKYVKHPAADVLSKMINELNRSGSKKNAGFYEYTNQGKRKIWQELKEEFPITQTSYSKAEIIERLLFVQVIEAVWCLQEGVVKTIEEGNLGSIYGWGFLLLKVAFTNLSMTMVWKILLQNVRRMKKNWVLVFLCRVD